MEGVWSFGALPDGSARWWFTPLELPPKLPDVTAPDLEEAERR
jgi:hypothetical protein